MNVCCDYRGLASNVYACFLTHEIWLVSGAKQKQGKRINMNGVSWTPGLKRRGLLWVKIFTWKFLRQRQLARWEGGSIWSLKTWVWVSSLVSFSHMTWRKWHHSLASVSLCMTWAQWCLLHKVFVKMTGENVLETAVQLCLILLLVGELRPEPKSFPDQGFHLGATFSSYCHRCLRRTQMPLWAQHPMQL